MKKIVAWAVVCKNGSRCCDSVWGTKDGAERGLYSIENYYQRSFDCGPHRIVKLVEERKKVSKETGGAK